METIGSRIRRRRENLGMTQDELAQKLGYRSRSSINKIELDYRNLTQSRIKAIADALDTTPSFIMGWDDEEENQNDSSLDALPVNVFPIKTKRIPLLGEIACGEPIYANEEHECYVMADADFDADFCLTAKGDSMTGARIFDGDTVFIRKQDAVDNGEIAAVIIGDEATLKRVNYHPDKNLLILKAENPKYQDQIYTDDQLDTVKILGKAIAFQSLVR